LYVQSESGVLAAYAVKQPEIQDNAVDKAIEESS